MTTLATPQLEQYISQQIVSGQTVVFDEFIFANIPNLTADSLQNHLTIPSASHIVHRQAISQTGVVNQNSVVYSVTIGSDIGDFDFNFIGLINKSKGLLGIAIYTDTVKKLKNKNGIQGNSLTRSILLEFSNAPQHTNITVPAETWQIDFTLRLNGLDEKIRLTNRDLYGRAIFFDEGFLLKRKSGNNFTITAGTAYVEGVRANITADENITLALPCSVYVDVVHHCTITGAYQTEVKFLKTAKSDYIDTAGNQHYVQILADIDQNGNITDRRLLSPLLGINPKDLDDTTENRADKTGHTHKLPLASLLKKGITQLFSGLDSDAEDMAATPKAIKILKGLIDAITRNLNNYIPNSKKSNAVDSNSADTVATSFAAKTAYDKGVEAKTAVDNLDRIAYKVNKSAGYAGSVAALLQENTVFSTTDGNLLGLPPTAYKWGAGVSMSTNGGKALLYVAHVGSQVWAKGGYSEDYSQPWKRLDGADWVDVRDRPRSVNDYGFLDFDVADVLDADLNHITKPGLYGQRVNVSATLDRNYPIQEAGTLLVTPSAYGVQQEYTAYNSNQKYVRGKLDTVWQAWKRIDALNKEDALVEHNIDLTSLDQNRWYPVLMQMPSTRKLYRFALYHALYEESRPSWGLHEGGFGVRCEWEVMPSSWGIWHTSGLRLIKHFEYIHCNQSPLLNLGQLPQESKEYVYLRGGAKYRLYCEPDVRVEISRSDYHGASGEYRWHIPMLHAYDETLVPKPLRAQFDEIFAGLANRVRKGDIAVLTGEIWHDGWLPIPAGFAEHECRFYISMNADNPESTAWDINEFGPYVHYKQECWTKNTRQAHCRILQTRQGVGQVWLASKANYLVIGIKS
ncbi:phage tail protein [Mannheimia bovis]|uniref:Phage tail protein n=1 Tax=Mannheimia bovis TaxID=2770636 RepID=A0A7H1BZY4_9PAST|nr:phage tail protein [Mannheimia bovis]QNS14289.1 phage tail protein [Mannheimia bovis]